MAALEGIAWYFLEKVLSYLLGRAERAIEDYEAKREKDALNEANAKLYEEALDRKSKIDAATNLLNGAKP